MAQYKIVLSYKIIDTTPDPDVTVAPNPDVPNASYAGSFDTVEQVKAFIVANAEARIALVAPAAEQAQGVLDAINPPPAP